ncbi:piggyBac transposable element-derived protein 4-like [Ixodes scapularis]
MATHLTDEEIQGISFPLESEASSDEKDENVPDFEAEEIVDDCESEDSTPDIPSTTATLSNSKGRAVNWKKTVPQSSPRENHVSWYDNFASCNTGDGVTIPFFKYFFTDELIDFIAERSSQYSVQTNPDRTVEVTSADVKKYVGICISMSFVHVPNIRDYWDPVLGNTSISSVMSVNQSEKIR